MSTDQIDIDRLNITKSGACLNSLLAISPVFIPRYPSGHTHDGDPIIRILYVLFLVPAIAAWLNISLAKRDIVSDPRTLAFGVVAVAPLVFYLKLAISVNQVPFRTDSGSITLWLLLTVVSGCLATLFFGISSLMGRETNHH